jgi:hypothetical protein
MKLAPIAARVPVKIDARVGGRIHEVLIQQRNQRESLRVAAGARCVAGGLRERYTSASQG